jgi:hypothetical protein
MDGAVVTLVTFALEAGVEVVRSDPRIVGRASDEAISEEGVEGDRGWGVWEGDRERRVSSGYG